ncbi:2010_t:CDS:2, partial [Entrophospora sp. SA101]
GVSKNNLENGAFEFEDSESLIDLRNNDKHEIYIMVVFQESKDNVLEHLEEMSV